MKHVLLVAAGGAFGAAFRHLTTMAAMRLFGGGFPWGTMTVNIVGSFIMGAFIELLARKFGASSELRLFIATGVLGGFTTFSSFSLDVAFLFERGEQGVALTYAAVSVVGAIAALFAGLWLVRALV